jgi:phosphoglycolate phosphatase-like HAD superfamily hydrolase
MKVYAPLTCFLLFRSVFSFDIVSSTTRPLDFSVLRSSSSKNIGADTTTATTTATVLIQDDGLDTATMYQKVKGIIFDIDGTLCDSWKLGYDATLVILQNHGIAAITPEQYHYHTRYSTPDRLARHANLIPGDDDYEAVGKKLGREFDDLYVGLVSTTTAGFYPGIAELLHNLPQHVMLGALTNAAVAYAEAALSVNSRALNEAEGTATTTTPLYERFRSIRGADNVPEPKPSPAGLWQVCQDMGLHPADCVYIGDSPSDGQAAHAAGMPTIGVTWGSHDEASLRKGGAPFSYLCHSIQELQQLLPTAATTAI